MLIFDEVQTGFGRTGDWFAANRFGVTPDIMAIAKGIASGLPLSATVALQELMEQWAIGSHSTTFGGNSVACAAACATIDVLKDEGLVENARILGDYALKKLIDLKEKHPAIGNVRGNVIHVLLGWSVIPSVFIGGGIVLFYTILGGDVEHYLNRYYSICGDDLRCILYH